MPRKKNLRKQLQAKRRAKEAPKLPAPHPTRRRVGILEALMAKTFDKSN